MAGLWASSLIRNQIRGILSRLQYHLSCNDKSQWLESRKIYCSCLSAVPGWSKWQLLWFPHCFLCPLFMMASTTTTNQHTQPWSLTRKCPKWLCENILSHLIDIAVSSLPCYVLNMLQNMVGVDGAHGDTQRTVIAENFISQTQVLPCLSLIR